GVPAVLPDLVEYAPDAIARLVAGLHHDDRHALGPLVRIGLGHDRDQPGVIAVRDEGLRTLDDVVPIDEVGARLHRLQIRAGARLGHRYGADQLARGHARQPALLLFLGTVVEQVVSDDA